LGRFAWKTASSLNSDYFLFLLYEKNGQSYVSLKPMSLRKLVYRKPMNSLQCVRVAANRVTPAKKIIAGKMGNRMWGGVFS